MQQTQIKTPARSQTQQVQRAPAATATTAPTASRTVSIPASLHIASPSSPAEREAERVSREVAGQTATSKAISADSQGPGIQRSAAGLMRKDGVVPEAVAGRIRALQSGGRSLPQPTARLMGQRFRTDFSRVRIHTGAEAGAVSRAIDARAFTVGSHVFFGDGQFQPDSAAGQQLIAHELVHVIQQGGAEQQPELIQRSALPNITERTEPVVQRLGLDSIAETISDYASKLPGFRMLTIALGRNPITGKDVERTPANVLQAAVEMIPAGILISDALKTHGIFDKAGAWLAQQLVAGSAAIGQVVAAVRKFISDLGIRDALSPTAVWERGKAILTGPIEALKQFLINAVTGLLGLIRDAILLPLAALAKKTPAWELLCTVIGRDPITKDPVPRTPETLVGGFLKLIGELEVWENMKKANAIARVFAWFEGAVEKVAAAVRQIPVLFMNAFQALKIADLLSVPTAFSRIIGIFGGFAADFVAWAANAIWRLLEIIFESVNPAALLYIKKTGAALKSILKNPLPFVGNLVKAAKKGFVDFAGNIGTHLKTGLIDWLTGSLKGVYLPKALSLQEIAKFVLSVLGLSWASIREKLVKAIGPKGETIVSALETTFELVRKLVTEGPMAAWEMLREQMSEMKDMAIGAIRDFVIVTIVQKAVPKLIAMFIPGAGFVSAIISIYETVQTFIQRISSMVQVVVGFIDSIVAIAAGAIDAAAAKVEGIMGRLLSLAISLLAGFLGLGGISEKIQGVIQKIRGTVDKAVEKVVTWIVGKAKSLFNKLTGNDKPDTRTEQERNAAKLAALGESQKLMKEKTLTLDTAKKEITQIGKKHKIRKVVFQERPLSPLETSLKVEMTNSKEESTEGKVKTVDKPEGKVEHHSRPFSGTNVGIRMKAVNLSKKWLGTGAGTGGGQASLMNRLPTDPNLSNGKKYVRGHLLNAELGGRAIQANLFPITAEANKKHQLQVEDKIKDAFKKDENSVFNYTVEIESDLELKPLKTPIPVPEESDSGKKIPDSYVSDTKIKFTIEQTAGARAQITTDPITSVYR